MNSLEALRENDRFGCGSAVWRRARLHEVGKSDNKVEDDDCPSAG